MKPPVIRINPDKILMGFIIIMVAVMSVCGIYGAIVTNNAKLMYERGSPRHGKCVTCPGYFKHKYMWPAKEFGDNKYRCDPCEDKYRMLEKDYERNKAKKMQVEAVQ